MQFRQLSYFVAVAENGSFSRAAESLYIAQSSLSQSVQNLEKELGFSLFKRSYSGVSLTEMGKTVYADAKKLLDEAQRLADTWKKTYEEQSMLCGMVRIAAVPGAHPILRKRMLSSLAESHPNIRCRVIEARGEVLLDYLAGGQADLVLCDHLDSRSEEVVSYAGRRGLQLIPLRGDSYKIAAGKTRDIAKGSDMSAETARKLPLACYSGGDEAAEYYFQRFFDRGLSEEYASMDKMIETALEGPAVSVLPELTVRSGGKNGAALRFMSVEGFSVPFTHFAAVRRGEDSIGEIAAVLEIIRRVFQEL